MYSYRQVKNMILFKSFRCVFVLASATTAAVAAVAALKGLKECELWSSAIF